MKAKQVLRRVDYDDLDNIGEMAAQERQRRKQRRREDEKKREQREREEGRREWLRAASRDELDFYASDPWPLNEREATEHDAPTDLFGKPQLTEAAKDELRRRQQRQQRHREVAADGGRFDPIQLLRENKEAAAAVGFGALVVLLGGSGSGSQSSHGRSMRRGGEVTVNGDGEAECPMCGDTCSLSGMNGHLRFKHDATPEEARGMMPDGSE